MRNGGQVTRYEQPGARFGLRGYATPIHRSRQFHWGSRTNFFRLLVTNVEVFTRGLDSHLVATRV
jgi:hypothetical protein